MAVGSIVVRVIDDQDVSNPHKTTAKRQAKIRLDEHGFRRPKPNGVCGEQQHQITRLGFSKAVGGHDRGLPLACDALERIADERPRDDVEPGKGFVEQQHIGALGKSLRHKRPLPLAAGQMVDLSVRQILKPHLLHGIGCRGMIVITQAAKQAKGREAGHHDRVANAQRDVRIHVRRLEHHRHRLRADIDRTGNRLHDAGDDLKKRRLARAVRTDDGNRATRRDLDADLIQRNRIFVPDGDVVEPNRWSHNRR